ncbi:MAG: hypothetical protein ACKOWD_03310 [Rhodoferax sp.]
MTETTSKLSPEEAQAIDAISATDAASHPPVGAAAGTIEPAFDTPVTEPSEEPQPDHDASEGFISAAEPPRVGHDAHGEHHDHDEHHGHEDHPAEPPEDDADMLAMRSAMLDSAELANRAAGMAAKAAGEMHGATTHLTGAAATMTAAHQSARIHGIVVLATFGVLMLTSMTLFGFMSYRLQSRITAADEMLLAVGKRIVTMNEAMEQITGAGETLRDIASRQDTIVGGQAKLDTRLDEVMTAMAQAASQTASKPADTKAQDLAKMIQALDAKLQAQSTALNALASQVRAVPQAPKPDAAAVRREVEAALRQQKAAEAASKPVVVTPPPAPAPKPKEALVQYPRAQAQGKESP